MRPIIIAGAAAFLLFLPPAHAQTNITAEEAAAIALREVPGDVIDTERDIYNGAVVYEFKIRTADGVVMEIEIDSRDGTILELEVDEMPPGATLPEAAIEEEAARAIAVAHLEKTVSGLRAVEILESEYTLRNGMLVYEFEARRGIRTYEVIVDAGNGDVVAVTEE